MPGLFAVGDVRSGSMKRVAAATGEGASAIASVHKAIAALAHSDQRMRVYPHRFQVAGGGDQAEVKGHFRLSQTGSPAGPA